MEAKLHDSMKDALVYASMNGLDGIVGVSKYEDKYLITGKEGECNGCHTDQELRFLDGNWLCLRCLIEMARTDPHISDDFVVRINQIEMREGVRVEIHEQ